MKMNKLLNDKEPLKYYPFLKGLFDVSPGLRPVIIENGSTDPDKQMFQFDKNFDLYRKNKMACRKDNLSKYYQKKNLPQSTLNECNRLIINNLCCSYPGFFRLETHNGLQILKCLLTGEEIKFNADFELKENEKYLDLFDAVVSQVQEDVTIWQTEGKEEWLAALHFCCPNNWKIMDKIGKNYIEVHLSVPGMEKWLANYFPMVEGLINKGPFQRFNWEIKDTDRFNLYPYEKVYRTILKETMYVRVERQLLTGLPQCRAILFTVKTFLYKISELESEEIKGLISGVSSMSEKALEYKGIKESKDNILKYLESLQLPDRNLI